MAPEILPPGKDSWITRVSAHVRLGRGVVGNTTFGLWGVCGATAAISCALTVTGHPAYALGAFAMGIVLFLFYQVITWIGVAHSPDPGVTADEDYIQLVATRQLGAKDPTLIDPKSPVAGGTTSAARGVVDA